MDPGTTNCFDETKTILTEQKSNTIPDPNQQLPCVTPQIWEFAQRFYNHVKSQTKEFIICKFKLFHTSGTETLQTYEKKVQL